MTFAINLTFVLAAAMAFGSMVATVREMAPAIIALLADWLAR